MQANEHFKPAVVYFDSRIPHCSVRCGIRIEFGQLFPKNGNGFILRGLISACGLRIQNPIPVFGLFLIILGYELGRYILVHLRQNFFEITHHVNTHLTNDFPLLVNPFLKLLFAAGIVRRF